jgi:hypothetical protein
VHLAEDRTLQMDLLEAGSGEVLLVEVSHGTEGSDAHRQTRRTWPHSCRRSAGMASLGRVHRIFTTSVASVYPRYVAKVEKKGRTQEELDEVIRWLTGFDEKALHKHLASGTTFEDFFAEAHLNPSASLITGSVCGVRVQEVEDPLMRQIRYLDKLVDELAKGRPMEKVLRG